MSVFASMRTLIVSLMKLLPASHPVAYASPKFNALFCQSFCNLVVICIILQKIIFFCTESFSLIKTSPWRFRFVLITLTTLQENVLIQLMEFASHVLLFSKSVNSNLFFCHQDWMRRLREDAKCPSFLRYSSHRTVIKTEESSWIGCAAANLATGWLGRGKTKTKM